MEPRLLAGPAFERGPESLAAHRERLGRLPDLAPDELVAEVEASGLLGRGGAGFPVGRKWRTVAERAARGGAVVLVNGAEGEPLSAKDRALMSLRPHLVLDGAELAARATGADLVVVYVGAGHREARRSIGAALAERWPARRPGAPAFELLAAPDAYVAGEETAAVHFVNEADARPTTIPPRPFEAGVGGRPTLVQNVESLAAAALVARNGAGWYREPGRGPSPGTALVTVGGAPRRGVREIELGATLADVAGASGVEQAATGAVLLGGYFGGWVDARRAWQLGLDPATLRAAGLGFGCGVVSFLPASECGVAATARIAEFMAGQSAAQCGPCVFGLRAIADATARIALLRAERDDLERLVRWTGQLAGRGACRHPDGAAALLGSALAVFGEEFRRHQHMRRCSARGGERRSVA